MPRQVNRGRYIKKELAPDFDVVHDGDDDAGYDVEKSRGFDPPGAHANIDRICRRVQGANSIWPISVIWWIARASRGSQYCLNIFDPGHSEFSELYSEFSKIFISLASGILKFDNQIPRIIFVKCI